MLPKCKFKLESLFLALRGLRKVIQTVPFRMLPFALTITWQLANMVPALADGLIVDKFNCTLQFTDHSGQNFIANTKQSAVRRQKLDSPGEMLYETPGQDLSAKLTLPSGFAVLLQMQYTFKRPVNRPEDWGLHTCLSGSMTDLSGHTSHWACPEIYLPVSEQNGIPQFDKNRFFEHAFELDDYQVKLSCTLEDTIS